MYQQYPPQQPAYYPQQQYGGCLKFFLYVLSFSMPLAGIIIGIIFMSRPDRESKSLGNACLIISIISMVLWCCVGIGFGAFSGVFAALLQDMPM
jgi:hypothetical protein